MAGDVAVGPILLGKPVAGMWTVDFLIRRVSLSAERFQVSGFRFGPADDVSHLDSSDALFSGLWHGER